jgi:hypothetical protein
MEILLSKEHVLSDHQGNETNDSQESDGSLIDRAFRGDQTAFELLISRYSPALFIFVRRHISEGRVEDIAQSVFLQLYLSLPQLLVVSLKRCPICPEKLLISLKG